MSLLVCRNSEGSGETAHWRRHPEPLLQAFAINRGARGLSGIVLD